MKGSTAQDILKILNESRLDAFLEFISREVNGDELTKLVRHFLDVQDVTEADVSRVFSLEAGHFYKRVNQLGELLIRFLGGTDDEAQMDHTYLLARTLVRGTRFDAAADVIRAGIRSAEQMELFDLIVRYWRLVAMFHAPPRIDGMDERTARRLGANLRALADLHCEALFIADEPLLHKKREQMEAILGSDLLADSINAMSKRAEFHYHKGREAALIHLERHEEAIHCQQAIIALIESYPWVCDDPEFSLANSLRLLGILYQITMQGEQHEHVLKRLNEMQFKTERAAQERDLLLFPISIVVAKDNGEISELKGLITAFYELIESRGKTFHPDFTTTNLYWCLYGAISLKSKEMRNRALLLLGQCLKPDFGPRYYLRYQFLRIIVEMQDREWDDVPRLIRNLRISTDVGEVPGLLNVLAFLASLVRRWSQVPASEPLCLDASERSQLVAAIHDTNFLGYFDLMVWFESLERGCPMAEIFHHRARSGSD